MSREELLKWAKERNDYQFRTGKKYYPPAILVILLFLFT